MIRALALSLLLAACGDGVITTAEPIPTAVPTAAVTSRPTPRPTPPPTLSPVAGLAEACAAISAFRGMADAIGALGLAASDAYTTGDYVVWEDAALGVNDQFEIILPALDAVPNSDLYRPWKASALEIMQYISTAIIAYDTGIQEGSPTQIEIGNRAFADANDLVGSMNEFASDFENGC